MHRTALAFVLWHDGLLLPHALARRSIMVVRARFLENGHAIALRSEKLMFTKQKPKPVEMNCSTPNSSRKVRTLRTPTGCGRRKCNSPTSRVCESEKEQVDRERLRRTRRHQSERSKMACCPPEPGPQSVRLSSNLYRSNPSRHWRARF